MKISKMEIEDKAESLQTAYLTDDDGFIDMMIHCLTQHRALFFARGSDARSEAQMDLELAQEAYLELQDFDAQAKEWLEDDAAEYQQNSFNEMDY